MRIVIVTGMSGAGKSSVLKMLEDVGYFCVDNIPIALIPKFICLSADKHVETFKVALGVDIRSGHALDGLDKILDEASYIISGGIGLLLGGSFGEKLKNLVINNKEK